MLQIYLFFFPFFSSIIFISLLIFQQILILTYNMRNRDCNQVFINKYYFGVVQQQREKIESTKRKLQSLSLDEKKQWADIIEKKCHQLFKTLEDAINVSELKKLLFTQLILLIILSPIFKITYNEPEVERILKHLYYSEHIQKKSHAKIVEDFTNVGFNIFQYDFWVYNDPWYTKMWKWISD